jgi:hypothetical protein
MTATFARHPVDAAFAHVEVMTAVRSCTRDGIREFFARSA